MMHGTPTILRCTYRPGIETVLFLGLRYTALAGMQRWSDSTLTPPTRINPKEIDGVQVSLPLPDVMRTCLAA